MVKSETEHADAGVDKQVRAWERVLKNARGRTRAAVFLLSGAAIIATLGFLLCINSPPARASVERISAHVAQASLTALEPGVARIAPEPLPRAPRAIDPSAAASSGAP